MSDETESDGIPTPRASKAPADAAPSLSGEASPLSRPPPKPGRAAPPPKPSGFDAAPLSPPATASAPPPARASAPPPARASAPPPPPGPEVARPGSIRPLPMIKVGHDTPRSEPPASALERPGSRPPAAPPTADMLPVLPPTPPLPAVMPFAPPAPPREIEPPTPPRGASFEPPTIPSADFDPPTEPVEALDETSFDEITPARISAPAVPLPVAPVPVPVSVSVQEKPPLPPARSVPPIAPSARQRADSIPDDGRRPARAIEDITLTDAALDDVPDVDVAPLSEGERISVDGDADLSVTVEEPVAAAPAPAAAEPASAPHHDEPVRKPPPPPKRAKPAGEAAPDGNAEPPKAEPPRAPPPDAQKSRQKPWWEELFSDDFGRGILPPNERQIRREVDFIEDSLAVAKGGVVLDLACGTGQHAVELSSRGYGVVGFDLSLPQLAAAGELAQDRGQKINFLQGDMREMSFEEVFDGIFCWNTSFGYFEEDRNFAVAQRVFRALRPGGSFLLDVVNRDFVVEHQPSQVWFEGDSCVCMDDMNVDFITSRLKVKRTIMLDDGRTRECNFSIRIYALHELGKLLHDIGFRVTEASGHPAYPGVFFGATSPRVVILAQKP